MGAGTRSSGRSPIAPVGPIPPLADGQVPLAILVDYDGTIAITDVGDTVMADHVTADWEPMVAAYDAGRAGSRKTMLAEIAMLRATEDELMATAAAQPHDPGFASFAGLARSVGIPVEIVSDGFGFFIPAAMERLGLADLPIVTATTTFDGDRARMEFSNGHPTCFVCGTCKRQRVLAHQVAGRSVVFIGDGESDRYAAGYSDVVFAKSLLARLCIDNGWPFHRWTEFVEIERWLAETITAWRADPASLPGPVARPFFCGPEVWGEGREDPPPTR
jgi:2-hydroxy-3-keto-5-methylthiopentenyl-1-phosphate phosphatase